MNLWTAGSMVLVALAAWGGFFLLNGRISDGRVEYTAALERSREEATRGESAARLRATIEGTEAERAALEGLVDLTILRAVEVVEQTGEAAGAENVTIGEATPTDAPQDLSAVTVVVNAGGSFGVLMRAASLFETLPIPATLEQFHLEKNAQNNSWLLTARLRVLHKPISP